MSKTKVLFLPLAGTWKSSITTEGGTVAEMVYQEGVARTATRKMNATTLLMMTMGVLMVDLRASQAQHILVGGL